MTPCVLIPVINFVLIAAIGSWLYRECRRRRRKDTWDAQDRTEVRTVAETAASDAASCAAIIDRLETNGQPRRRLHAVHDERSGKSSWHWE
jgi:hypothetical protein